MPDDIRLWRVRFRVLAPWGGDQLGYSGKKFVIAPSKAKAKELVLASAEWAQWYAPYRRKYKGTAPPAPSIGEVKLLAVSGPIVEQAMLWDGRDG